MAGLGSVGGSEELFLGHSTGLGDQCGGKGSLRATSAHILTSRDFSKHKTLLSSFSCGERQAEGGKGRQGKEKVG